MSEDNRPIDVGNGIYAVDTEYMRPGLDASHVVIESGRAAFVDTGTSRSVPLLLGALASLDVDRADVDYVLLTHIHLDHAGGAGELMRALPNARAVLHPRGAPHMIEPAKLETGTRAVYGDAAFDEHYGTIVPIDAARVIEVDDDDSLELAGRPFRFIHTPGHALHHYCIVDPASNGVFTGDNFGISYRPFDTAAGPFVFPTTTPTHFDPDAMHASIDRIVGFEPDRVYLTHFSRVGDVPRLADDLHAHIDAFVAIARQFAESRDRTREMRTALFAHLDRALDVHGYTGDQATRHSLLDMDVDLNVQGLEIYLERMKRQAGR